MSGPVRPPLTVKESDDSVTVRPTNAISFNAADFTVAASGSTATISIDSTGTGAALTRYQIGFGDASNLMTGSTKLTWDDTAGSEVLAISGTNDTLVTVTSTDTNAGIKVDTPNDGYAVVFFAEGGTNKWSLGKTAGAGDAFSIYDETNSRPVMQIATNNTVTFNQNNIASADFTIESQGNSNMFKLDSSQNNIGIGMVPPSGHGGQTVTMAVRGDDDGISLMLQNDGADADDGPEMVLYRNSASPAADDLIGRIRFDGEDSGGNIHNYFRMTNAIKDPTDASEDGRFLFESRSAGSLIEVMRFEGDDIDINANNLATVDVKIRGDNDTILFSDASQDNLGMGTSSPSSGVERLHIVGTGAGEIVRIESTDDGAGSGPDIVFLRNSASPAVGDDLGTLSFKGKDSVGNTVAYANIKAEIDNPTDTDEAGRLEFDVRHGQGGTTSMTSFIRLLGEANSVQSLIKFNDDAQDIDFIYEDTSGGELVKFDLGNSNVGIGGAPDSGIERLHVLGTDASKDLVMFESTDTDGNDDGPDLVLYRSKESPGDGTQLGSIKFRGRNNATADIGYAHIEAEVESGFGTSANGLLRFGVVADGTTPTDVLYVSGNNGTVPNVGIGTIPDSGVERLHVKGSGTGTLVRMESTDAGADTAPDLDLYRNSASPASNDFVGYVSFTANTQSSLIKVQASQIATRLQNVSGDAVDSVMQFYTRIGNANRNTLQIGGATIFNQDGQDVDFRIESNTNDTMFYLDAGDSHVGIGAAPSSTGAQFQVNENATFQSFITNQNSTTILTSALVKNSKIICNPSSNITVTLPPGSEGDRVTIVNVSATNTAQLAFDVSDSSIEAGSGVHPRALSQAETETWLCYKDNNWVLESFV